MKNVARKTTSKWLAAALKNSGKLSSQQTVSAEQPVAAAEANVVSISGGHTPASTSPILICETPADTLAVTFNVLWKACESFKTAARCSRHSALKEELHKTAKLIRDASDRVQLLMRREGVSHRATEDQFVIFNGCLHTDRHLTDREKDAQMMSAASRAFVILELKIVELEGKANSSLCGALWSLRQVMHSQEDLVNDLQKALSASSSTYVA